MEALDRLRSAGQSLWMVDATREQIYHPSLMQYIEDGAITGLFLSPQAVCHTLSSSSVYDDGIYKKLNEYLYGEALAFDLILEDIRHAADLLRYIFDRTDGVDGWAVLPLSPLLSGDTDTLLESASELHARVKRPNSLITVSALPERLGAIEEIVFAGIPINISLIYSCDQYMNAAEAYLRGIERRIAAELKPTVSAFISIPIFHLASTLAKEMKQQAAIRASIAIARNIYKAMRTLHTSRRWARAYNAGARPSRLIWVISDDELPTASDLSLYDHLIAPFTVAAMSERTMEEFINRGHPEVLLPADGDDCEKILASLEKSGLNFEFMANSLQDEAASWQVKAWITLLDVVARKSVDVMQTKSVMMTTEK